MIKIQAKVLHRPSECVPYVAIVDPFTAERAKPSCFLRRSVRDGGSMLTSVPVSTKKVSFFVRSVACNRRHVCRPDAPVAASSRPGRLTVEPWRFAFLSSTSDGTSTWKSLQWGVERGCRLRELERP